ncbi:MAG: O-antigen ligase family protein [Chloroflexi bacterium]|nr:O-antigen ligase family protein [Chloroflexota bacterium]MBU1750019.1 O-antigen ligase family protein [Chloroflexota bacterium]
MNTMKSVVRWLACQELWLMLPLAVLLILPSRFSPWAVVGVVGLWLLRWAGRGRITLRTPVDLPILLLLLTVPVGLWASADLSASWPVVYQVVAQVGLFYALVNTVDSDRWFVWLAAGLVLLGVAVAVFNLAEMFLLGERLLSEQALAGKGPLGVPKRNIMGGVLGLLLPIPLALTLFGRRALGRWLWALSALGTLVVGGSLLLAQTRGAWVGVLVAVLAMAVWYNRRFAWLIPVIVAVLALATWYVGPSQMADMVLALDVTNSAQGRWEIWQRGVYMIQDFPFTGVGLGMFSIVGDLLYPLFTISSYEQLPHVHNVYLQAAIDGGLPGLVAFVGLWLLALVVSVQAMRRAPQGLWQALAVGFFGSVIVYLVHGLTDSVSSFARAGIVVWGVLGALMALWLFLVRRSQATDG